MLIKCPECELQVSDKAISDITEKTYTERPIEWLAEEIEKIKQYDRPFPVCTISVGINQIRPLLTSSNDLKQPL